MGSQKGWMDGRNSSIPYFLIKSKDMGLDFCDLHQCIAVMSDAITPSSEHALELHYAAATADRTQPQQLTPRNRNS